MFATMVFALILSAPSGAHAESSPEAPEEYDVRLKQSDRRVSLGLFGGLSQFARQGQGLQGTNLEGVVDYAVLPKWAAQFTITQSLALGGGLSLAYTGFRLGPSYALRGEWMRRSSALVINGHETISVKTAESNLIAVDAAADQILFNGTARIVPATGVSVGLRYDRRVFGYPLSFMGRYGSLVVTNAAASVMTVGLGIVFHF